MRLIMFAGKGGTGKDLPGLGQRRPGGITGRQDPGGFPGPRPQPERCVRYFRGASDAHRRAYPGGRQVVDSGNKRKPGPGPLLGRGAPVSVAFVQHRGPGRDGGRRDSHPARHGRTERASIHQRIHQERHLRRPDSGLRANRGKHAFRVHSHRAGMVHEKSLQDGAQPPESGPAFCQAHHRCPASRGRLLRVHRKAEQGPGRSGRDTLRSDADHGAAGVTGRENGAARDPACVDVFLPARAFGGGGALEPHPDR